MCCVCRTPGGRESRLGASKMDSNCSTVGRKSNEMEVILKEECVRCVVEVNRL